MNPAPTVATARGRTVRRGAARRRQRRSGAVQTLEFLLAVPIFLAIMIGGVTLGTGYIRQLHAMDAAAQRTDAQSARQGLNDCGRASPNVEMRDITRETFSGAMSMVGRVLSLSMVGRVLSLVGTIFDLMTTLPSLNTFGEIWKNDLGESLLGTLIAIVTRAEQVPSVVGITPIRPAGIARTSCGSGNSGDEFTKASISTFAENVLKGFGAL